MDMAANAMDSVPMESDGKIRLRPPKRTMSAYSCYSHAVYVSTGIYKK